MTAAVTAGTLLTLLTQYQFIALDVTRPLRPTKTVQSATLIGLRTGLAVITRRLRWLETPPGSFSA